MRILIVSKILLLAAYRRKLDEIAAQPGVDDLAVVTPPTWREPGGRTLELEFADSGAKPAYELHVEPIRFNGNYHLFYWPGLGKVIREFRPDLVHMDEEPYNVATAHGTWLASKARAKSVFFTWQNLRRRYPPPFNLLERIVYERSAHAMAGSREALGVLRAKHYAGPASVIPQFGVDPDLFSPGPNGPHGAPIIGFISRLVEEKGLLVLLGALVGLQGQWRLHVIGTGPQEAHARRFADQHGLRDRITWERGVPSEVIPNRIRTFWVLVQPSLTRRHWKEQFGRAMMEAMACGIPVIGSASAAIPIALGNAGLVVPEADPPALRAALARVLADPGLRTELGRRGRQRVLECFTHRRIAEQTVAVYRSVLEEAAPHSIGARIV